MSRLDQQKQKGSKNLGGSVEIERKFLVQKLPDNLAQFSPREILQGYLALTRDGTEVRIRRRGARSFLTVKRGTGKKRVEEEISINHKQFSSLWGLTEGKRVEKVRYRIPHEGLTIELDVYHQKLNGLVTAEVEFPSEAASIAFQPPSWLGTEITDDERYKNRNLACRGLPQIQRS